MTSKTFDNYGNTRKLHIESTSEGFVSLKIWFGRHDEYFTVPNDIIPSISLALLESAGFEDSSSGGHITGARIAVGDLKRHVKMQERITAEAKEQAELGAEALELYNARISFLGGEALTSFEELNQANKDIWIVVARKARELGGRTKK